MISIQKLQNILLDSGIVTINEALAVGAAVEQMKIFLDDPKTRETFGKMYGERALDAIVWDIEK